MKREIHVATVLLGLTALIMGVTASNRACAEANPYRAIVRRNVFDLGYRETNDVPPIKPTLTVKLTGIATIVDPPQALFMVEEPDTPGKPNKEESYILSEGQRQGPLELLEINEKESTVRIKNDGVMSVVSFDKTELSNAGDGGVPVPGASGLPKLPTFVPGPAR